jgi:hypothetical protein
MGGQRIGHRAGEGNKISSIPTQSNLKKRGSPPGRRMIVAD